VFESSEILRGIYTQIKVLEIMRQIKLPHMVLVFVVLDLWGFLDSRNSVVCVRKFGLQILLSLRKILHGSLISKELFEKKTE